MKTMPKYVPIVERVLKQELVYPEDTREKGALAHPEVKKSASVYLEVVQ
jgi:hypothetical protein